jgi:uncharacterized alkaline shock family protein YloU
VTIFAGAVSVHRERRRTGPPGPTAIHEEETQIVSAPTTVPTPTPRSGIDKPSAATAVGGRTQIGDVVVSKIAGLATREIAGVHALGGGAARALGALRERIPGATTNVSQGVSVEVGETQAAIDIDLVVEYGAAIADLAAAIRRNVVNAVERMTGLEVVEVNITVNDVHLPGEDVEPAAPAVARVA